MNTPLEVIGESTWRVTATCQGIDLGVWDTMDGGDSESNASTYQPAGSRRTVPIRGGRASATDITITRGFFPSDWDLLTWLISQQGIADVDLAQAITDAESIPDPAFRPMTAKSRLKSVQRPKVNASSESASMIGLILTSVEWARVTTPPASLRRVGA